MIIMTGNLIKIDDDNIDDYHDSNLIKIDDDDDNIDDYHDWPPFPLWLRIASSIVPISLSCNEALPPSSSQTKPKQTTPTM